MLKIILPLATPSTDRTSPRTDMPPVLTEIAGQPLLETVVANLRPSEPHQFVFVTCREDVRRWAVDDVARLVAPGCAIVVAPNPPKTSVFASLLAIEEIEADNELLVGESNRFFDGSVDHFLSHARGEPMEGCIASFRCTHPKWNYLRVENGEVLQVVQRRPVSDQAVAPLLWVRQASDYFEAAERHLVRHLAISEGEETSGVVNELVLAGRRIGSWRMSSPASAKPTDATNSHRLNKTKPSPHLIDS